MVLGGAAASGITFDGLPMFLDVLLVMFVFPFVLLIGALLVDAKLITPCWPGWLKRRDGHEADTPGLLVGAVLAASIAAIYPGMFPARTYANLARWGPAYDVQPETAPRGAGYYSFRNSTLRVDLGGSRSRRVVRNHNDHTTYETVTNHAAPIVGSRWSAGDEVVAWAVSEGDVAPWREDTPTLLQGVHVSDERNHALRAVEMVAEEHGLTIARKPIMIELGESYDELLSRSRWRTWIVLAPLSLLVFAAVAAGTWSTLRAEPLE